MKTLNYKNEEVTLTELENTVVSHLRESDTMDDCYCDCPEQISIDTEIPMKQLRGVISSLDKKGVAYMEDMVSGCPTYLVL